MSVTCGAVADALGFRRGAAPWASIAPAARTARPGYGRSHLSGRVVGHVLQHSPSRGNARMVLVVIAEAARDDGTDSWPSLPKIAARAALSERTVIRAVAELERSGEITVERRHRRNNRYTIPSAALPAPTPIEQLRLGLPRVPNREVRVTTYAALGDTVVSPHPSVPVRTEPSSRARMVSGAGTQAGAR